MIDGGALPATLAETRDALHRLAEYVLAPARYAVTGRIGLRPHPGGFATPPYGDDGRVVAVEGTDLVVRSARPGAGTRMRAPITTLRAAAELVGIDPVPHRTAYEPTTAYDPDAPLPVDAGAAALLAHWYALGAEALHRFASGIAEDEPSQLQLWPEHFDLGIEAAGVNYGASPGDEHVAEPYLYVGPHGGPPPEDGAGGGGGDDFWNATFGAVRTITEIASADDAVTFYQAGRDRARRHV